MKRKGFTGELTGKKMTGDNWNETPTLAIAYIGDAVYELLVRTHLLQKGIGRLDQLHRTTVRYVQAKGQATLMKKLQPELDDSERAMFLRGRNTKGQHPRNIDVVTYRHATGFETLIGYLYLTDQKERLEALFDKITAYIDRNENGFPSEDTLTNEDTLQSEDTLRSENTRQDEDAL